MGRYFTGMIEGKFWFAVQSSTAADRFGVSHNEPSYVEYYYSEDDLEGVEEELKNIEDNLGNKLQTIIDFFEKTDWYKNEDLEAIGISRADLSEYADYTLGVKIRDCIRMNGECTFEAEL
jgi:hypothetical protein